MKASGPEYQREYINESAFQDKEEDKKTSARIGELLGQKRVNMLFSKDPKEKCQALIDFKSGIQSFSIDNNHNPEERQQIYVALFACVRKGLADFDSRVNV